MGLGDSKEGRNSLPRQNTSGSTWSLDVSIDVPSSITAGEQFDISASISLGGTFSSPTEQTATVELYLDGTVVATKEVSILEGGSKSVSFSHTFVETGDHTVAVGVSVTILGVTKTAKSQSRTVSVGSRGDPFDQATGAAFGIPDSLDDEVTAYRDQYPIDEAYAFVLIRPGELYIVFTETKPQTGEATVSGPKLDQSIGDGTNTFGVVVATDITFTTIGTSTTVSNVASSPDSFALDLVRIEAQHERISTLTDPDQGDGFTAVTSLGRLKDDPSSAVFTSPGTKCREIGLNARPDDGNLRAAINDRLATASTSLTTFNLTESYWTAGPTMVDALVLTSGGTARQFLADYDPVNVTAPANGEPVLYVVDTGYSPTSYDSVSGLKAGARDGDLVEITVRSRFLNLSVQELIEHATPACGPDQVEIPTPSGPACVNVVQDVLFQAGVCWTTVPTSLDEVLFVAGLSSKHQDDPWTTTADRYTITGEVVSTARFDDSLPEAKILLIYDLEDAGSIDYGEVADEAKAIVEEETGELAGAVQRQIRDIAGTLTDSWTFDTGHRIQHSNVAIDGGTVYVGGLGQTVYALDEATGDPSWTFTRRGSLADSGPAIRNGTLVIGSGGGYVYGLDAGTGDEQWGFETKSAVVSSPTIVDGTVYVGDNRGRIHAIDLASGANKWTTDAGAAIISDPVVDSGTVYVTTTDGYVTGLDTASGGIQWQLDLGGDFGTRSPLVANGFVYLAGERLYALSPSNQAIEWSTPLDGTATTSPAIANGNAIVGTDSGSVQAVAASGGQARWTSDLGSSGRTTVRTEAAIVYATNGTTLALLDAFTGTELATSPAPGLLYAPPIVANGTAYLLGGERITALDVPG